MGKALTILVEPVYQQDPPPYGAIVLKQAALDSLMARKAYDGKLFSESEISTFKREA